MLGLLRRLFGTRTPGATAAKQQGDVHALDREGDPRGGVQSDEYRHAEPRELVTDEEVAMSGPGGAPMDGSSAEERRLADRPEERGSS